MVGLPRNKIDRFENPARGRRRLVLGGGAKVRLVAKFIARRAAPRPTKKVAPAFWGSAGANLGLLLCLGTHKGNDSILTRIDWVVHRLRYSKY